MEKIRKVNITIKDTDIRPLLIDENKEIIRYSDYDFSTEDIKPYWRYIVDIARECYVAGLNRSVDELNKQADREVKKAQSRAIKKLMQL